MSLCSYCVVRVIDIMAVVVWHTQLMGRTCSVQLATVSSMCGQSQQLVDASSSSLYHMSDGCCAQSDVTVFMYRVCLCVWYYCDAHHGDL